jgi:hypothetical protein
VEGNPDPAHVSTSHVERQNLTMRMHLRLFTRLTNAFSKKFSTMSTWLRFTPSGQRIRIHKTLKMSPAMASGLSATLWSMDGLCEMMEPLRPSRVRAVLTASER